MTASNKLKAKLFENNLTQSEVAKQLGMSAQTFNYKLNNRIEFKASEIERLCKLLNITDKDSYFFCESYSQIG